MRKKQHLLALSLAEGVQPLLEDKPYCVLEEIIGLAWTTVHDSPAYHYPDCLRSDLTGKLACLFKHSADPFCENPRFCRMLRRLDMPTILKRSCWAGSGYYKGEGGMDFISEWNEALRRAGYYPDVVNEGLYDTSPQS